MGQHLHRLSAIDPDAKTAICKTCGPVAVLLRQYSAGPAWVCREAARAREKVWNTAASAVPARARATEAYEARRRRQRLVDRTVRCLLELTVPELEIVLTRLAE